MEKKIAFKSTDGKDKDFIKLCMMLDSYLNEIVGGEANRSEYIPHNLTSDIIYAVVAYNGNEPVGCAGLKHYDGETAEVKRVFVKSSHRNNGIAKSLMKKLHEQAKEKEYIQLILETGEPLSASVELYKKMGYKRIENYDPYVGMEESICFKKFIQSENK